MSSQLEPRLGDPVDTSNPNGPRYGDPGHPLPASTPAHSTLAHGDLVDTSKPNGPRYGDRGYPLPGAPAYPTHDTSTPPEPPKPVASKVGDVVVLKSGGPAMTVSDLAKPGEDASVFCTWFCPHGHDLHKERFLIALLASAEEGNAKCWAPAQTPSLVKVK